MKRFLLDSNVWLALTVEAHVHGEVARGWFSAVSEPRAIAFSRMTQQSLLRLLTSASVFAPYGLPPLTNIQAWGKYDDLLQDSRVTFLSDEPPGLQDSWRAYAERPSASPKLWMDAYLAAFARASDYQLVTTDRGFRQFRGLDLLVLGDGAAT